MTIGERIRKRRIELGISQGELADALGYKDRSSINKIEKGTRNIVQKDILRIAQALRTTPSYIMGWADIQAPKPGETVKVKVVDNAAVKYGQDAIKGEFDTIDIPSSFLSGREMDDYVVVTVKDDSMLPEYKSRDKVLVLLQANIPSGQIGAFIYEESVTLKKIVYDGRHTMLLPLNNTFLPTYVEDEENLHVLGIPKVVIRNLN